MIAFYKGKKLIKVCDRGDDFQVIIGLDYQRWFSTWRKDYKGSLEHAVKSVVEQELKEVYDPKKLVYTFI